MANKPVEKVKEVVEKVIDKVAGLVDVELIDAHEGFHQAFTTQGVINFENGVAKVAEAVAEELRTNGVIK